MTSGTLGFICWNLIEKSGLFQKTEEGLRPTPLIIRGDGWKGWKVHPRNEAVFNWSSMCIWEWMHRLVWWGEGLRPRLPSITSVTMVNKFWVFFYFGWLALCTAQKRHSRKSVVRKRAEFQWTITNKAGFCLLFFLLSLMIHAQSNQGDGRFWIQVVLKI